MYCITSPFSKTFDEVGLIYFIPDFLRGEIKKGMLVEIPIKNDIEDAIVLDIIKEEDVNIELSKIKSLISIKNKNILISENSLEIIKWIGKYYFAQIHNCLNLFIPKGVRTKLIKNKLELDDKKEIKYSFNFNKKLSPAQNKAYEDIKQSKNNKLLLYGLTGSGKTEIYIKLIKDNLDSGKQSLILIPEIILTNQIFDKLKQVFSDEITIINSSITDGNKTKAWISIYNTDAKIIIGTRSSLFYPYNNLGLIIVDEEHDQSYISDKSPRYSSTEICEKISQTRNIKTIFASGTPSVKSMYKGVKKEYELVSLLEKFRK